MEACNPGFCCLFLFSSVDQLVLLSLKSCPPVHSSAPPPVKLWVDNSSLAPPWRFSQRCRASVPEVSALSGCSADAGRMMLINVTFFRYLQAQDHPDNLDSQRHADQQHHSRAAREVPDHLWRLVLPNRLRRLLHQALGGQPAGQPPAPRLDSERRPQLGRFPRVAVQHVQPPDVQLCLRRRHHQRFARHSLCPQRSQPDRPGRPIQRKHCFQAGIRTMDRRKRSLRRLDRRQRRR